MSAKTATKSRLAAEVAQILFPNEMPSDAWSTLDRAIEQHFDGRDTARLGALLRDVAALRQGEVNLLVEALTEDAAGRGNEAAVLLDQDSDLRALRDVIDRCAQDLGVTLAADDGLDADRVSDAP
ncbi:MAG: hypothetical protein IT383_27415 [Deltaproteobacteria bacterium]|nr:hypothetical protein [Deltaproteobacteria bacterium]